MPFSSMSGRKDLTACPPNNPAIPLKPGQSWCLDPGRDEEGNYLLSTVSVETPRLERTRSCVRQ